MDLTLFALATAPGTQDLDILTLVLQSSGMVMGVLILLCFFSLVSWYIIIYKFVFIRMNQGSMHRGLTLDAHYGRVMRTYGVPCFFVLDEDGEVDAIQRDAPLMSTPNRAFSVEKIAAWLEEAAAE